jgi:hypothetical protein
VRSSRAQRGHDGFQLRDGVVAGGHAPGPRQLDPLERRSAGESAALGRQPEHAAQRAEVLHDAVVRDRPAAVALRAAVADELLDPLRSPARLLLLPFAAAAAASDRVPRDQRAG